MIHLQFIRNDPGLIPVFAERLLGIDFLQRNNVGIPLLNDSNELFVIKDSALIDTAVNVVGHDPNYRLPRGGFFSGCLRLQEKGGSIHDFNFRHYFLTCQVTSGKQEFCPLLAERHDPIGKCGFKVEID